MSEANNSKKIRVILRTGLFNYVNFSTGEMRIPEKTIGCVEIKPTDTAGQFLKQIEENTELRVTSNMRVIFSNALTSVVLNYHCDKTLQELGIYGFCDREITLHVTKYTKIRQSIDDFAIQPKLEQDDKENML